MSSNSNLEPIVVETMDQAIGRRVHQLIWSRRTTNRALGQAIGVDPSGLGRRLRGERGWSSDELAATARYFDVSVATLFGEPAATVPPEDSPRVNDVYQGRLASITNIFDRTEAVAS